MNRPNIEAIKARADAALEQPCHERHQIINPCLSCESNIQRSLRTDIPELLAYIAHLETKVAALQSSIEAVQMYDEFVIERAIKERAALRACGYKGPTE